jgi:hypothetical protein
VDGRGDTLQHRPADLGARERHRLRHPADSLRPRHRDRCRTPAPPGRLISHRPAGRLAG